jgi:putative oxidoreductase
MTIKAVLSAPNQSPFTNIMLLVVRVVGGVGFMLHGWGKIQSPFDWMGPDAWAPGFLQALAALAEFGGGFAWVVGLVTPLASAGIACTMSFAVYFHAVMRGDPFVNPGGSSYELALVYLCLALLIIALGPGRFSLDRIVFGKRSG